jgi:hypothetical protein
MAALRHHLQAVRDAARLRNEAHPDGDGWGNPCRSNEVAGRLVAEKAILD